VVLQADFEDYLDAYLGGMATLIAALLSLGNMSRHNEIIAMRAGGVSLGRIIMPVLAGGLLISVFSFINNEFIMPVYSTRANYIRNIEIEKKQQRIIFQQQSCGSADPTTASPTSRWSPEPERNDRPEHIQAEPDYSVRERIRADSLLWENGAWRLRNSRTYMSAGDAVQSRSSDGEVFNIVDSPEDLGMIIKTSAEMNFSEMWNYIKRLRTGGYKAVMYEVDLHNKIAFPFASLLMAMISIPFSIHGVRSGGAAKGFAFAILIAFVYWTLMSVGASLGRSGAIPPLAAAWFANMLFGIAAVIVLFRMQRSA
jgi:lipopolysaccharide export system permease protein